MGTTVKKRVLLWVFLDTHFREMFRVARLLQTHALFEPVILFYYRYPVFAQDLARCRQEGVLYEDRTNGLPLEEAGSPAPAGARPPLAVRVKEWARSVYRAALTTRLAGWFLPVRFWLAYRQHRGQLAEAAGVYD